MQSLVYKAYNKQNLLFSQDLLPGLLQSRYRHGIQILYVSSQQLLGTLATLKYHRALQYKVLTAITCVDFPSRVERFEIIYELLSVRFNKRLRIKVSANEIEPLNSVATLFKAATWWESEVWDMFGVFFLQNNEIKRILTDYGFEGFPLRKDFPLSGFIEVRYNERSKRVVCEPLEHAQEFRHFKFMTGW